MPSCDICGRERANRSRGWVGGWGKRHPRGSEPGHRTAGTPPGTCVGYPTLGHTGPGGNGPREPNTHSVTVRPTSGRLHMAMDCKLQAFLSVDGEASAGHDSHIGGTGCSCPWTPRYLVSDLQGGVRHLMNALTNALHVVKRVLGRVVLEGVTRDANAQQRWGPARQLGCKTSRAGRRHRAPPQLTLRYKRAMRMLRVTDSSTSENSLRQQKPTKEPGCVSEGRSDIGGTHTHTNNSGAAGTAHTSCNPSGCGPRS